MPRIWLWQPAVMLTSDERQTGQHFVEIYYTVNLLFDSCNIALVAWIEGLGWAKGVLVCDIPDNFEVAQQLGHSFRVGDGKDLRAKLKELLENSKLVWDTKCRITSSVKKYDWDHIAERYEYVYMSLLWTYPVIVVVSNEWFWIYHSRLFTNNWLVCWAVM